MSLFHLYQQQAELDFVRRSALLESGNGGVQYARRPIVSFVLNPDVFSARLPFRVLVVHVGAIIVCALSITVVVFYTLPRHSNKVWNGPRGGGAAAVGFNQQVAFGESQLIEQSEREVMRVTFTDLVSDMPYPIVGEPYFRGAVLTDYQASTWQPLNRNG